MFSRFFIYSRSMHMPGAADRAVCCFLFYRCGRIIARRIVRQGDLDGLPEAVTPGLRKRMGNDKRMAVGKNRLPLVSDLSVCIIPQARNHLFRRCIPDIPSPQADPQRLFRARFRFPDHPQPDHKYNHTHHKHISA